MSFQIAIDGPAGAGKSTIAKRLAKELSFLYVDTGAMYRAMAVFFLTHGIPVDEETAVSAACGDLTVSLSHVGDAQHVYVNGTDVSDEIRREEVGSAASVISTYPAVREALLMTQRSIAAEQDVIMDGRDIGTCILPDAQLKVYLTASIETRAQRRYLELQKKGESPDLTQIQKDIAERDDRDRHRKIAPLRAAEDAITVDTSDLTIEEVVERMVQLYVERR